MFFFFKQKTAYEMRISDWSSYVCSSDLEPMPELEQVVGQSVGIASQQDRAEAEHDEEEPGESGLLALQHRQQHQADTAERRPGNRRHAEHDELGRASCRERWVHTCRSRWSPSH